MGKWLEARRPTVRPPGGKTIEEIASEVIETLAEPEEERLSILTFQRNDKGLVLRAATIRAHLKDCARVLSSLYIGKIKGERSFATKVVNGLYPDERHYWIPILRPDGTPVETADGEKDKAIHVRGPHGEPMNALKRFEFVEPARIDFTLKILGGCIKTSDLEHLLTYGGVHGYGGERSDGEGKYLFTLTEKET